MSDDPVAACEAALPINNKYVLRTSQVLSDKKYIQWAEWQETGQAITERK